MPKDDLLFVGHTRELTDAAIARKGRPAKNRRATKGTFVETLSAFAKTNSGNWAHEDLNLGPRRYQRRALPTEL